MESYKSHTVEQATAKLMRFCTYRERCHKEVREKLKSLNMILEAQDQIISQLLEQDFLNEERFAKIFVQDKFRIKKWGKYRLVRELKYRQISEYLIKKSLKQIDEKEYQETFQNLLEKRLDTISETHPLKIKRKVADYLLRKGYESSMIYESLGKLEF